MTNRFFPFVAAAATVFAASAALAQPGGGFRGPGGRGIGMLLMNEDIRNEIKLEADQQAALEELRDEMRDEMRSMFSGMRDLGPEERRAEFERLRGDMEALRLDAEERIKGVLGKDQFDRLQQIELQQQMQRGGGASLTSGRLVEALDLSPPQIEEMQQKAAEAQRELEEKIQQLRLEAREKVLSVLTTSQRTKFDELVGEPFEMQPPQFGRGQRGGNFGRGGPDRGPRRGRDGGQAELE